MKKTLFSAFLVLCIASGMGGVAEAADQDGDGISDNLDNCPLVSNPDQIDNDYDHIGFACDGDWDGDGVSDAEDNCWDVPNPAQMDLEGDGVGDNCDLDRDGDGYTNNFEIAVIKTSPDDWDSDGDNVSDYYDCDKMNSEKALPPDCTSTPVDPGGIVPQPGLDPFGDEDDDGILNGDDNCPTVFNPGQQDLDEGGLGDLCDNGTGKEIQVLFAKGGGGIGAAGCSFIPPATPFDPLGSWSLFALLLPAIRMIRRRAHST